MKYFSLSTIGDGSRAGWCFFDRQPEDMGPIDYRMSRGVRIADEYPPDASLYMRDEYPGMKLSSLIGNTKSFLITSMPMKEVIDNLCKSEIEYLPLAIYNHKRRLASRDYFIINPIGGVDCLNLKASEIEYFEGDIVGIDKYVLDTDKLEKCPDLFRIPQHLEMYVISERLAEAFQKNGFTNIVLEELEQKTEK
ncbi:MAG: double-CXXCG motif protein [Gemmataceae bacterium]|nr:double-CXXCG motif protein [Gemmataceae bacterium]MCI0738268.1 double-CXXCG motif protein [Gemmataceae bacterium]